MDENKMTFRQGMSLITMYLLGSSLVIAGGLAEQWDTWLSILLAYGMTLPLAIIYARLMKLSPDGDYYDLQLKLFGPVFGRVTAILYVWFAYHLGALVIRNFSEFIQLDSLSEQAQYLTAIPMGVLAIWCVISGRMTLARWAAFMFPIFVIVVIVISLLSTQLWQSGNLMPFLYDGFDPVLQDAFSIAAFPFAEAILLPFVLHPLRETRHATRLWILSFTISMAIFTLVALRNLLVLGSEYISTLFYPSYIAIGLINIGNFLDRLEVAIAAVFVIGGFVKITVCLYAASLGMSKVLKMGDSRSFAAPIGILMIVLSQFVYKNILDTYRFAFVMYKFYILPTSVAIPVILWIICEIRRLREKKRGQTRPIQPAKRATASPPSQAQQPSAPNPGATPPPAPGDGTPATEV